MHVAHIPENPFRNSLTKSRDFVEMEIEFCLVILCGVIFDNHGFSISNSTRSRIS